jgi:hypothetical protein
MTDAVPANSTFVSLSCAALVRPTGTLAKFKEPAERDAIEVAPVPDTITD